MYVRDGEDRSVEGAERQGSERVYTCDCASAGWCVHYSTLRADRGACCCVVLVGIRDMVLATAPPTSASP